MYVVRLLCQVPEARADFEVGAVLCCAVLLLAVEPGSACATLCQCRWIFRFPSCCHAAVASVWPRFSPAPLPAAPVRLLCITLRR